MGPYIDRRCFRYLKHYQGVLLFWTSVKGVQASWEQNSKRTKSALYFLYYLKLLSNTKSEMGIEIFVCFA